ncbi:MAG: MbnP family protein [Janthinobacterium lividum]
MKRFFPASFLSVVFLATLALAGCKKNDETPANQTGEVDIELEHTVGAAPLALSTQTYTTPAGDQFTVSKFKYYLSNLKLTKTDGTQYAVPESYYLVDAASSASQHLALTGVPVGDYTGLAFTIGVDSARNVSGAQTGALDVNNDMFWTWNSGYIFTKFEGTSPQAPHAAGATTGGLIFHIGGFKSPNNTIRTVSPAFPSGTNLLVRADHTPEIHYEVDVLKMFTGPTTVRFATLSNTMGGANSVLVANNYAQGMFSVEHIHAN